MMIKQKELEQWLKPKRKRELISHLTDNKMRIRMDEYLRDGFKYESE